MKLRLGLAARAAARVADGEVDAADRATAAIGSALADADRAIDELRDLLHGIYPSALDTDGLAAALLAQARLVPVPVRVHDELAPGQRYPRDVEAAAYFCCLEALQNAVKHAAAGRVEVRLWGEPGRLSNELEQALRATGLQDRFSPSGRWRGTQAMTAHDFAELFDVRRPIAGKDVGDIPEVARAQQTRTDD